MIFASVLEDEISGGGVGAGVVDESVGAATLEIFGLHVDLAREVSSRGRYSSSESEESEIAVFAVKVVLTGPVAVTQSIVHLGREGEEGVLARSGERTGDQEYRCGFVDRPIPAEIFVLPELSRTYVPARRGAKFLSWTSRPSRSECRVR